MWPSTLFGDMAEKPSTTNRERSWFAASATIVQPAPDATADYFAVTGASRTEACPSGTDVAQITDTSRRHVSSVGLISCAHR